MKADAIGGWLTRLAAVIIASLACLRLITPMVPMPYWDLDPRVLATPTVGFGPVGTMAIDLVTLFACAVGLGGLALCGRQVRLWPWGLWLLGALTTAWHMLPGGVGQDADTLRIGSVWLSSTASALTLWSLCGDRATRRLVLGLLIGVAALLCAKGLLQVLVEHPRTLERFEAEKQAVFEAQGWAANSRQALQYERRITQNDATGWIGLSNVFGSIAAVAVAAAAGLIAAWQSKPDSRGPFPLVAGVLVAIGLVSLVISGSKGAAGAAVLGCAPAAFVIFGRDQLTRWAAGAGVGIVILVVALRGLIGERLGELSLLFRWFYFRGASAIGLDKPLVGSGPAGFRDAFVRLKPPRCPEDVTSAHNVLLDWWAMLGLGGLAWGALLIAGLLVHARCKPTRERNEPSQPRTRLIALAAALTVGISAASQQEAALLESSLTVIAGLGLWVWIAIGFDRLAMSTEALRLSAIGGLTCLLAHAQIEMTLTIEGAALWGLAVVGATLSIDHELPIRKQARRMLVPPAAPAFGFVIIAVLGLGPVATWADGLRAAADALEPTRSFRERAQRLSLGREDPRVFIRDLGSALGERPIETPDWVGSAIRRIETRDLARATDYLQAATDAMPRHRPTVSALSRTAIGLVQLDTTRQDTLVSAEEVTRRLADARPESAAAWIDLARLQQAGVTYADRPDDWRLAAMRSALRGVRAAPRDLTALTLAADLAYAAGDRSGAAGLARRALEADTDHELDPLTGLTEPERARMASLAEAGSTAGS
ncbi:MAG: O-antigen ligase family protein [Planctomycetota bacterium]